MRNGLSKRSLKTECGILNLDVEHGSGTHWTCWYKLDSTHCYYFDSYGLTSPSEFDMTISKWIFKYHLITFKEIILIYVVIYA